MLVIAILLIDSVEANKVVWKLQCNIKRQIYRRYWVWALTIRYLKLKVVCQRPVVTGPRCCLQITVIWFMWSVSRPTTRQR